MKDYDHVVFDTAPTGHTLRLMSLAKAWDQFLDTNTSGTSCLGPLAGLEKQRVIYEATVKTLADAAATTLVLVSRPQLAALREAERTSNELRALGVRNQRLIINGIFETTVPRGRDRASDAATRGGLALASASAFIGSLPSFSRATAADQSFSASPDCACCWMAMTAQPANEAAARRLDAPAKWKAWKPRRRHRAAGQRRGDDDGQRRRGQNHRRRRHRRELAKRGHSVHLSTTDPAAHVAQTLAGQVDGLTLSKIDPAGGDRCLSTEVMRAQGAAMDEAARSLLEEDLRSPCTEEIAVFRAFAREVGQGTNRFVVLDTAPTGHTLLLLDASEAYQRELERQARTTPARGSAATAGASARPGVHPHPARHAARSHARA